MTRSEIHNNFIGYMERVRTKRGYTIARMSDVLGLPQETYKNIIYEKSQCIDISIACKLYDLTHDWMYRMCGYRTSDFEVLDKYLSLDDREKAFMEGILDVIIKNKTPTGE